VLVNGQTGVLVGDAPTSWWKVAAATLAVVVLVGAVIGALLMCGGAGSLVAGLLS
jgi:hypothetical protein